MKKHVTLPNATSAREAEERKNKMEKYIEIKSTCLLFADKQMGNGFCCLLLQLDIIGAIKCTKKAIIGLMVSLSSNTQMRVSIQKIKIHLINASI